MVMVLEAGMTAEHILEENRREIDRIVALVMQGYDGGACEPGLSERERYEEGARAVAMLVFGKAFKFKSH